MSLAFWLCAAVTLISSLVSLGFSVAAVRSSTSESAVNAMYATARSASLAIVCLIPLFSQSEQWLFAVALGMTLVQAFDAVVGQRIQDRMKTFGPASLAVLNLVALGYFVA